MYYDHNLLSCTDQWNQNSVEIRLQNDRNTYIYHPGGVQSAEGLF